MRSLRSLLRPASLQAIRDGALPLKLTALILLTNYVPVWYLRPPTLVLACLILLFSPVLRSRAAWGALVLLSVARVVREWPSVDNHQYLLAYWLLAIFIALSFSRPYESLSTSGRWLIAFVFLFATIWKGILSPDYLDGRFYRARLLNDERFAQPVLLVSGLDRQELEQNRAYLSFADSIGIEDRPARLNQPRAYSALVDVSTWGTIVLEGAVALAFLFSWGRWTLPVRHTILLIFCATTYLVAPVYVFGWLLLIIGLAQVPLNHERWRVAYLAVFFLLQFYIDVPWISLLTRLKSMLLA